MNREQIRNMFGGKCAYCGCVLGKSFHVDHVDAIHRELVGHKDRDKTALKYPACRRCNLRKSTLSIEQFRDEITKQVERLYRDSSAFRLAYDFGAVIDTVTPVKFYFERYGTPDQFRFRPSCKPFLSR